MEKINKRKVWHHELCLMDSQFNREIDADPNMPTDNYERFQSRFYKMVMKSHRFNRYQFLLTALGYDSQFQIRAQEAFSYVINGN